MVSLRLQLTSFLTMIVIGGLIGISFDFYRFLKSKFDFGYLITDLIDILFFLLASLLISGGLIYSNSGRVRFFFLSGVLVGLIIYYSICSRFTIDFLTRGWRVINQVKAVINKELDKLKKIYYQSGDDSDE